MRKRCKRWAAEIWDFSYLAKIYSVCCLVSYHHLKCTLRHGLLIQSMPNIHCWIYGWETRPKSCPSSRIVFSFNKGSGAMTYLDFWSRSSPRINKAKLINSNWVLISIRLFWRYTAANVMRKRAHYFLREVTDQSGFLLCNYHCSFFVIISLETSSGRCNGSTCEWELDVFKTVWAQQFSFLTVKLAKYLIFKD